ncbi:MAG: hypothetical protein EZS28_047248, partial [Streblomastix strix]
ALIQECVAKAESIQSYPTGYGGGIFVTGSGEYDAPTLKLNLEGMNIFENIAYSGGQSLYVVMTKIKECSNGVTICCPLCGAASLLRERSAVYSITMGQSARISFSQYCQFESLMTQWKYDQLSPEQHQVLDDLITDTKTMKEDDIRRILVSEHQMQENEDEIPYDDQESRAIVVLAQLHEAEFMKRVKRKRNGGYNSWEESDDLRTYVLGLLQPNNESQAATSKLSSSSTPIATRRLPGEQPEQSRGEESESVAEATIIKIAAREAEMIKKENAIELENALKAENQRISAQHVPLANSSIQPATQAQAPQVIQNQLENSQRSPPELTRRLELIKKKEATDLLINSIMTKLLADFMQVEKGSFNPLKNNSRPDFETE